MLELPEYIQIIHCSGERSLIAPCTFKKATLLSVCYTDLDLFFLHTRKDSIDTQKNKQQPASIP